MPTEKRGVACLSLSISLSREISTAVMRPSVLACLAAVSGAVFALLWRPSSLDTRLCPLLLSSVQERDWSQVDLKSLLRERRPVLIRGGPSLTVSVAELADKLTTCRNVMTSRQKTFFYYDPRHPLTAEGVCTLPADKYRIQDFTGREFLERVQSPPVDEQYTYYSTSLNETSPALNATFDLSPFRILPSMTANFWSASAGCVSRLHYDASHNIFAQMLGDKRFLLISPRDAAKVLPLYPASHPMHRASALDLSSPNQQLCDTEVLEAKLGPGDLLYVPPFYFHHVETVTASASLNMYLPSVERADAQRLERLSPQMVISPDWLDVVQLAALNYIVRSVTEQVYDGGAKVLAHRLWDRFAMLRNNNDGAANCDAAALAGFAADDDFRNLYCLANGLSLEDSFKSAIDVNILRTVDIFKGIPVGTRELLLLDWVEYRILMAVPSHQIPKYLYNCLI